MRLTVFIANYVNPVSQFYILVVYIVWLDPDCKK